MMDKMEKAKAGMPQKTSIEISRMIVEEEWQGETGLLMPSSRFRSGIRIRLSTVRGVRDGYISRR